MEMLGTTGFRVSNPNSFEKTTREYLGTHYKKILPSGTIINIRQHTDGHSTKTIMKSNGYYINNTENRVVSFFNSIDDCSPVKTFFNSPKIAKEIEKLSNNPKLKKEAQLFLCNPKSSGIKKLFPVSFTFKHFDLATKLKTFSKEFPAHLTSLLDNVKLSDVHGRWFR